MTNPTPTISAQAADWAASAPLGEVAGLINTLLATFTSRAAEPEVLNEFDRWREPDADSELDWNTYLAVPEEHFDPLVEGKPLIAPENPANSLPEITCVTNELLERAQVAQAVLFNVNKRAIAGGEHEQLLGVRLIEKGPRQMYNHYEATLNFTRKQVNELQRRAEHLFSHLPEEHKQLSPSIDPVPAPLPHFGAALVEQPTEGSAEPQLALANADLMIDYYRRLRNYAEDSEVPEERFTAIWDVVEREFLTDARQLSSVGFRQLLRRNEDHIKSIISQDGPEPKDDELPAELDGPKKSTLFIHDLPHTNMVRIEGTFYGEDAERLRTMKYQVDRLTPNKLAAQKQQGLQVFGIEDPADLADKHDLHLPDEAGADLDPEQPVAETQSGETVNSNQLVDVLNDPLPEEAMADAFMGLLATGFRTGQKNGIPTNRGHHTTMITTIDLHTLTEGLFGSVHDPKRHETQFGGHLEPNQLRTMACDAELIPAVFNGKGQPLDLGRGKRLFSFEQYIAMVLRDGGCTVPGCTTPASWCHTHHIKPWEAGGETDISNGTLLCQRHHTEIHQGKWIIVSIDEDGAVWYRRSGTDPGDPAQRMRNTVWDLRDFRRARGPDSAA